MQNTADKIETNRQTKCVIIFKVNRVTHKKSLNATEALFNVHVYFCLYQCMSMVWPEKCHETNSTNKEQGKNIECRKYITQKNISQNPFGPFIDFVWP